MVAKAILFSAIFGALLCSCATNTISGTEIHITSISTVGTDGKINEFCSDFNLTVNQAQNYFSNAKVISAKEMHDFYSYLPCFVKGKCSIQSDKCEWEIRAGGTGILTSKNVELLFGCKDCF